MLELLHRVGAQPAASGRRSWRRRSIDLLWGRSVRLLRPAVRLLRLLVGLTLGALLALLAGVVRSSADHGGPCERPSPSHHHVGPPLALCAARCGPAGSSLAHGNIHGGA